jgi:hypothetical protein
VIPSFHGFDRFFRLRRRCFRKTNFASSREKPLEDFCASLHREGLKGFTLMHAASAQMEEYEYLMGVNA